MTPSPPRPVIYFDQKVERQILSDCEKCYPEEGCGILIGRREGDSKIYIEAIVASKNILQERRVDRYVLDPADQAKAEIAARRAGLDIIGFYHSHPDVAAIPSNYDRDQAWPDYIYLICEIRNGKSQDLRGYLLDDVRQAFVPLALKPGDEQQ